MHATPPPRAAKIGFGVAIFGILTASFAQRPGTILAAVGLIVMLCAGSIGAMRGLLAEAASEWTATFRALRVRRRLWRRRAEIVTAPSPTVDLAWQMLSLAMVLVLFGPAFGFPLAGLGAAVDTAGTLGFTVALFDLVFMGMAVMRWPWGRTAGKWFKVSMAAIVAAIALSFARQSVTGFISEDPSKVPTFLAFLTIAHLPMAWAITAAVVGTFALLPALIRRLLRVVKDARRDRFGVPTLLVMARGLRPVFVCGALLQLGLLSTPFNLTSSNAASTVASVVLINADFFEQTTCGGKTELAARLDDGRYLVADQSKAPFFRKEVCAIERQSAFAPSGAVARQFK